MFHQINWLAFVVGTAFTIVLGFLWYGPLFARLWVGLMEKAGRKQDEMQASAGKYLLVLLAAAVSSCVLALIITNLGVAEWWMGLVWGVLVWFGAVAATSLMSSIFEGRRTSLWLLYCAYQLVVYGALDVLYVVWR